MDRREFLNKSARGGVAAWTALSASRVRGANDRIRVALIGCGRRGSLDARLMRRTPHNVEIATLCDVDARRMEDASRWAPRARKESEFPRVLDDQETDVALIATTDRWHAPMLIQACAACKDVYLEVPAMCRVGEAQAMVDAVRGSRCIVQVGSQYRSAAHIAEAARMVRAGELGSVGFVRVWDDVSRMDTAPHLHFGFDSVHQIMAADTPLRVSSSGQQATYQYPHFVMSYEARAHQDGRPPGMAFHGTEATLFVDRLAIQLYPESRGRGGEVRGARRRQDEPTLAHIHNFLDSVRSRQEPAAGIEVGVRAATVACIGNLAS